MKISW